MILLSEELKNDLIQKAKIASLNAHSPYSSKKVGAAVLWENGAISTGCNIENASYGATVCAERVAIWSYIAANGKSIIDAVAVYVDEPKAWPPCGLCRQVISEFATKGTLVIFSNGKDHTEVYHFNQMFPGAFSSDFLK